MKKYVALFVVLIMLATTFAGFAAFADAGDDTREINVAVNDENIVTVTVNGTYDEGAWAGIYKKGENPGTGDGTIPSIYWWTLTDDNRTMKLPGTAKKATERSDIDQVLDEDGNLVPGDYFATVFSDSGYKEISELRKEFTVPDRDFDETEEIGAYSITIIPDTFTDTSNAKRFTAYQIFSGKLTLSALPGSKEERELADITWGNGIDAKAFLEDLKKDPVIGEGFKDIDNENPDAAALTAKILDGRENDSEFAIIFSRVAARHVKKEAGIDSTFEDTDKNFIIDIDDPGYYIVIDNDGKNTEGDARSAYILDVLGTKTVKIKADAPNVDKEIIDPRDEDGKNKGSSYDIGDSVGFRLTGTLPENYAVFTRYFYEFTDTLSEGLTYNEGSLKVYLYNWEFDEDGNKIGEPSKTPLTEYKADSDENSKGYVLKVDGQVITVTFNDLKAIEGVKSTSQIVVEYSAVLNEKAVTGNGSDEFGNINRVKLTYSNDPNDEGNPGTEPPTNDTPEKKVYVYTFSLDIHKIASDTQKALEGAGFTLTRTVGDAVQYAYFIESSRYTLMGWADSTDADVNVDGEAIPEGAIFEMKTDKDGKIKVYGIGSGSYVLKETTTPDGYNTMKDIIFEIIPTYNTDDEGHEGELTKLEIVIDGKREEIDVKTGEISISEGNIPMQLVNDRAPILPSTGGIGTKLFYIVGGAFIAGVLAFLMISFFKKSRNDKC